MKERSPFTVPEAELQAEIQYDIVYVGFWARVLASLVDTVLILVITFPLLFAVYGWDYFNPQGSAGGLADVFISWILPAIAVLVFWYYKSATPGKMLVGAKVVDSVTYEPLSKGQCIGRYIAYYVSMIPLFLGFIWVGIDGKKQGWHDKLSGSIVIKSR